MLFICVALLQLEVQFYGKRQTLCQTFQKRLNFPLSLVQAMLPLGGAEIHSILNNCDESSENQEYYRILTASIQVHSRDFILALTDSSIFCFSTDDSKRTVAQYKRKQFNDEICQILWNPKDKYQFVVLAETSVEYYSILPQKENLNKKVPLPSWIGIDEVHVVYDINELKIVELERYMSDTITSAVASRKQEWVYLALSSGKVDVVKWMDFSVLYSLEIQETCLDIVDMDVAGYSKYEWYADVEFLVLCFGNGKASITSLDTKRETSVNTMWLENEPGETKNAICCKFGPYGQHLAIGWHNSTTTIFQCDWKLFLKQKMQGIRVVSNGCYKALGYASSQLGAITALAWSSNGAYIAVGYQWYGFGIFSAMGERLISTVPNDPDSIPNVLYEYGVENLFWTKHDHSLLVLPQIMDDAMDSSVGDQEEGVANVEYAKAISVLLTLETDGLLLNLTGERGKVGCWIHMENSFLKKSDGSAGPAENCGKLKGGDFLTSVRQMDTSQKKIEEVIQTLYVLPKYTEVEFEFCRVNFKQCFLLAMQVMECYHEAKMEATDELLKPTLHKIMHFFKEELDEDQLIMEYALRMQATHGDFHDAVDENKNQPGWLEFEKIAMQDGWKSVEGCSVKQAKQRYVRLFLSFLKLWNPIHCWGQLQQIFNNALPISPRRKSSIAVNEKSDIKVEDENIILHGKFVEIPVSRNIKHVSNFNSLTDRKHFVLLGSTDFQYFARQNEDASKFAWVSVPIHKTYCTTAWPITEYAESNDGNHIAFAGTVGFAIYSIATDRWRRFGNVHEESEITCTRLAWIDSDIVVALCGHSNNLHGPQSIKLYPRNHLDESSLLHDEKLSTICDTDVLCDHVELIEVDSTSNRLYCIAQSIILVYKVSRSGSLKENSLNVTLSLLIAYELEGLNNTNFMGPLQGMSLVHRVSTKIEKSKEPIPEPSSTWFSSFWGSGSDDEVPSNLPRFLVLDAFGNLHLWDMLAQTHRLLCHNTTMVCSILMPDLPVGLRQCIYIYGPDGLQLWLPELDGLFESADTTIRNRLKVFLQCQDPTRELPRNLSENSQATALYERIVSEYDLPDLAKLALTKRKDARLYIDYSNSLQYALSKDEMIFFNPDKCILGVDCSSGVLLGYHQDSYTPYVSEEPGMNLSCLSIKCNFYPVSVVLLRFVCYTQESTWIHRVISHCFKSPYGSIALEVLCYSVLEDIFHGVCSVDILSLILQEMQAFIGYREILSKIARKVEPNRLPLLFPLAGEPHRLFHTCLQEKELQTASRYLLVLGSEGLSSDENGVDRLVQDAAVLLDLCLEENEFHLGHEILRVVERISKQHYPAIVQQILDQTCWTSLVAYKVKKVSFILQKFDAHFPANVEQRQREINFIMLQDAICQDFNLDTSWLHDDVASERVQQFLGHYRREMRPLIDVLMQECQKVHLGDVILVLQKTLQDMDRLTN